MASLDSPRARVVSPAAAALQEAIRHGPASCLESAVAYPNPPEKIVPFDDGPVAAHDIGRQFAEHAKAIVNVLDFVKSFVRDDAVVRTEALPAPVQGPAGRRAQIDTSGSPEPTGVLGPNAGGKFAADDPGGAAVAADYAQVAIEWAEHMPDTIPPNILAINAITGEHWSARWWAQRAASVAPVLAASLYYIGAQAQTIFPLTALDYFGKSYALNQAKPESVNAYVNGARLTPTVGYTVNTTASTVTLAGPVSAGAIVCFDILVPASAVTYVLPPATTTVLGGVMVDGTSIVATGAGRISATYAYVLPVATTTILGGVKVDGATIKAAGDGTISTVVQPVAHDNRIINGDMRIDQRNGGATTTPATGAYVIDRWKYLTTQASKFACSRASFSPPLGFPFALLASSQSAFTPAAGDTLYLHQPIEADMVSDFAWGTASAQAVTLSFWAMSSLSGTFGGAIKASDASRSFPFSYTLAANTAAKITINIPGDQNAAWSSLMSGNAAAFLVIFDLGTGATYRAPAGAWASGGYNGANGSVNVCATSGANFYVTGVKLEIGSVATPFNRQSLAKSMADCQRYYQQPQFAIVGYTSAGGAIGGYCKLSDMRAAPTITIGSVLGVDTNIQNANPPDMITPGGFRLWVNGTAAAVTTFARNLTANAEL